MVVAGQLNVLACSYPLARSPLYPLNCTLGLAPEPVFMPWSREKSNLLGIDLRFPGCPNHSLVTVRAALSLVSMLVFIYNSCSVRIVFYNIYSLSSGLSLTIGCFCIPIFFSFSSFYMKVKLKLNS